MFRLKRQNTDLHCSSMPRFGVESNLASAKSTWWLLNIKQNKVFIIAFKQDARKQYKNNNAQRANFQK